MDSSHSFGIRLAPEIVKRLHATNKANAQSGQEAVDGLITRIRGFIGKFEVFPATGDYLEMTPDEAYFVQSRSLVATQHDGHQVIILIRDVRE
jgi:hypothetical protein